MDWRLFAPKLETAETMEGVALNMRAPYSLPDLNSKESFPWWEQGIPPPFLSYGDSSMVVLMTAVGLLMNISVRRFILQSW